MKSCAKEMGRSGKNWFQIMAKWPPQTPITFLPPHLLKFHFFYPCPLIFAANLETGMVSKSLRSLLVAGFAVFMASFFNVAMAQHGGEEKHEKKLDPAK